MFFWNYANFVKSGHTVSAYMGFASLVFKDFFRK